MNYGHFESALYDCSAIVQVSVTFILLFHIRIIIVCILYYLWLVLFWRCRRWEDKTRSTSSPSHFSASFKWLRTVIWFILFYLLLIHISNAYLFIFVWSCIRNYSCSNSKYVNTRRIYFLMIWCQFSLWFIYE